MHRLTAGILGVNNDLYNTNFPIHERLCFSPSLYYLDWFEKSYPIAPLNQYESIFYIQCINGIHGTKPARWQYNQLLDEVVTIIKYKKITIDHAIYIKVFSGGTVSCLKVYTDDVLKTTNNETEFPELRIFSEEAFEIKLREGYFLKYLNFRVLQSPLSFSIYQTDHIIWLVNEWLPTGKFRNFDTNFWTESTYEK